MVVSIRNSSGSNTLPQSVRFSETNARAWEFASGIVVFVWITEPNGPNATPERLSSMMADHAWFAATESRLREPSRTKPLFA